MLLAVTCTYAQFQDAQNGSGGMNVPMIYVALTILTISRVTQIHVVNTEISFTISDPPPEVDFNTDAPAAHKVAAIA